MKTLIDKLCNVTMRRDDTKPILTSFQCEFYAVAIQFGGYQFSCYIVTCTC